MKTILEIENLWTRIHHKGKFISVCRGVSLDLKEGETLCLAGESGGGKTMTVLSLCNLLPKNSVVYYSRLSFDGRQIPLNNFTEVNKIRGRGIAYIFQEAASYLNPLFSIGEQIKECIKYNLAANEKEAARLALLNLEMAGLSPARDYYRYFSHQLSGGMNQRAMIAMAISSRPKILVADEPTSALDQAVAETIVNLIKKLIKELALSCIWITHDLALAKRMADRICVIREGEIIESSPTDELWRAPKHPDTQNLISCLPERLSLREDQPLPSKSVSSNQPLLTVRGVTKYFPVPGSFPASGRSRIKVLDNISFSLKAGETVGLLGESGSGKTTLARILAGVISAGSGSLIFSDIIKNRHRDVAMVFQNPFDSLDPRMTVEEALLEPLLIHRAAQPMAKIEEALDAVGLTAGILDRLPHQFSGGQRQRIAIARAIAPGPKLLICDEPTSFLDLCIQAQILRLLTRLKDRFNLTIIFISHNLEVVRLICDRIMVMRSGIIVNAEKN